MNYFLEADKVNLSLDAGTEETFLDLKGVNGFTRTINNLRSLTEKIKRTGSKLRVDVSYVIGVKNYRDILRTTRLVKSSGADNIIFRVDFTNPIAITGLAPEVIEARTMAEKEDTEKFKVLFAYSDDEIREGKQSEVEKTKKCFNHNFWACIGPNRELYTCGHRTYSEVKSFGSLLDKSLLELWLSPERLKTVGNLPDENCKFCSPSCKRRDCLMNVLMCLPIDQVEELHDKYVLKPKIAREERKHGN